MPEVTASLPEPSPAQVFAPTPKTPPNELVSKTSGLGKEPLLAKHQHGVRRRRLNVGLGLCVGAKVDARSDIALAVNNSTVAAVLGTIATFRTGVLTTLNAGNLTAGVIGAANGYREREAASGRLRPEFHYVSVEFARSALDARTAGRLTINWTGEPRSRRALRLTSSSKRASTADAGCPLLKGTLCFSGASAPSKQRRVPRSLAADEAGSP